MRRRSTPLIRRGLGLALFSLSIMGLGCGSQVSTESSQEVAKNQQSASSAWADAKANGTAKTGTKGTGGGPGGSQSGAYRR